MAGSGDFNPPAAGEKDSDSDDTCSVEEVTPTSETPALTRAKAAIPKNANAYQRARMLIDAGAKLHEFRDDLQTMLNIWMQSKTLQKTKEKVEELLVLLEGTQEGGPWSEYVDDWKLHLMKLPANF